MPRRLISILLALLLAGVLFGASVASADDPLPPPEWGAIYELQFETYFLQRQVNGLRNRINTLEDILIDQGILGGRTGP